MPRPRPGRILRHGVLAVALAAACTLLPACAQLELMQLYMANNGTEARTRQPLPLTLPFREVDGWVIVPASINGSPPLDFVLDTGASLLALLDGPRTEVLGLDMSGARRLGAEGDVAAPVGVAQPGLDIDFGALQLLGQTALAIPVDTVKCRPDMPDPPFQGVIGHELFHRYVVEFDYDRQVVVLHDPDTYQYHGAGTVVPARIRGRQPFVDARVEPPRGEPYMAHLHVDSGAGIDLSLFPQTSESIRVPVEGTDSAACFVGGLASYRVGTTVALGLADGLRQETPVMYSVGKEVIDSGQNGRIGARFLRRYNVVFDYARERMILEPRRVQAQASAPAMAPARS